MVGRIFRCKATKKMKNSSGRMRTVKKNQLIYHRGNNRYAVYSVHRDKKRVAGTRKPAKGYGQTADRNKRKRL